MAITPLPQSDAVPERPIKILLVEDERALREALADALTSEGFVVTQAETGAAGLAAFRAAPPDLILLDLMLPEMGGIEVCRSIRSSSHVPIIMVTAKASETDLISGLDLGGLREGDRLRIGPVESGPIIQLSEPAAPCKNIAGSFEDWRIARVSHKVRPEDSRWYARVLREGPVVSGDPIELLGAADTIGQ